MDIHAKKGTKVKFIEDDVSDEQIQWGSHDDPIGILEVGKEYTIERTEVHGWSTKVYLEEFPSKEFNSVWFE